MQILSPTLSRYSRTWVRGDNCLTQDVRIGRGICVVLDFVVWFFPQGWWWWLTLYLPATLHFGWKPNYLSVLEIDKCNYQKKPNLLNLRFLQNLDPEAGG